jgi:MFS family permease
MKDDFGVGYAQLGLVLGLMYTVSGVCQVLAGFAVNRFGARRVLLFGMAMMSSGIALVGLSNSYAMLFIGAFCAGLGNSVFHPAGWYIDHGVPRMVFVSVALCMLLTIVTVASLPRRQARALSA